MDPVGLGGLAIAGLSFVLAALAFLGKRQEKRADDDALRRSEPFRELLSTLAEQRALIDIYRTENARQQAAIAATEAKAAAALEAHASCEGRVAQVEARLHTAEARIAELGG